MEGMAACLMHACKVCTAVQCSMNDLQIDSLFFLIVCVTVKRLSETDPLHAPCSFCHAAAAAQVPLYAANVALCNLKLVGPKLRMPGVGPVPTGGHQPFGSVPSHTCGRLRGA